MATEEEMNDAQKMGRLIMDYDVGFMALTPSSLKPTRMIRYFCAPCPI